MSAIKPKKKAARKLVAKKSKKANKGFDKAWEFWKTANVDLSNFKFDREEANVR
jgi:hypothetical protein